MRTRKGKGRREGEERREGKKGGRIIERKEQNRMKSEYLECSKEEESWKAFVFVG